MFTSRLFIPFIINNFDVSLCNSTITQNSCRISVLIKKMASKTQSPTLSFKSNLIATFDEIKLLKNDKNVLLIDVREPSELKQSGVIPGSINIPLGDVERILKTLTNEEFKKRYGRDKPNPDFPLVFSCKAGTRSARAVEVARHLGYKNLRNFSGGWTEWEKKSRY